MNRPSNVMGSQQPLIKQAFTKPSTRASNHITRSDHQETKTMAAKFPREGMTPSAPYNPKDPHPPRKHRPWQPGDFEDSKFFHVGEERDNSHLMESEKRVNKDPVDSYARMSELVYHSPESRASLQSQFGLDEYQINTAQNNDRLMVMDQIGSNQSVIVHRGTDTSSQQDLGADVDLVTGLFTMNPHYQSALDQSRSIIQSNPGREYTMTGHSLGGTTAHYVGNKLGIESHAFNPGHSWLGNYRGLQQDVSRQHHLYATEGDWISSGIQNETHGIQHWNKKRAGTKNEHSVLNWIQGNVSIPEI